MDNKTIVKENEEDNSSCELILELSDWARMDSGRGTVGRGT